MTQTQGDAALPADPAPVRARTDVAFPPARRAESEAERPLPFVTAQRRRRLRTATALADDRDGVLTRSELTALGIDRWAVRRHVEAGRWVVAGRHCIVVYTGRWDQRTVWRVAVAEVGAGSALDGLTGLEAAGLRGASSETVHLSIPRGAIAAPHAGTTVHETRRRRDSDLVGAGIRRVRPSVAAVRAALWAVSDRQAALFLAMTVQQRIASAPDVWGALETVLRHPRRKLLRTVMHDITDGAQSMGELDFTRLCRAHQIPPPSRQVIRQGPRGRIYLDASWDDCDLVVEIDGVQHEAVDVGLDDALRQNSVTIAGSRVLRIPVLGLRVAPDAFMEQVRAARHRLCRDTPGRRS